MSEPLPPDQSRPVPRDDGRPIIGPADPDALAYAAEQLRDRTMHLEPDEPVGIRPRVWALIGVVVALAGFIVLYRHQVKATAKWMLGLW